MIVKSHNLFNLSETCELCATARPNKFQKALRRVTWIIFSWNFFELPLRDKFREE